MTVSPDLLEGYGKADMSMDSLVGEKVFGLQAQPRRLRSVSQDIIFGFSRSPFFMSPCLTALTWQQIEFPKTHTIEQLLDLLKDTDTKIASNLRGAVVLTPYGVDIRYPGDQPEPNQEEACEAVELACKVRNAVMDRLGEIQ